MDTYDIFVVPNLKVQDRHGLFCLRENWPGVSGCRSLLVGFSKFANNCVCVFFEENLVDGRLVA